MKKVFGLIALAAMLGLSPAVGPAGAADLLVDDFDGYRAGEAISAGTTGWRAVSNAASDPLHNIWTDLADSHRVVMQAYGAHVGCWASDTVREIAFPADPKTKLYVSFDMMSSGDIQANGTQVWCPENRYDVGARLIGTNAGVWNGRVANLVILGATGVHDGRVYFDNVLASNQWYRMLVEVDRSTGAKRLWRDGEPWADLTGKLDPALLPTGSPVGHISITSGGGRGWADRVRVFTDELAPATTATLSGTLSGVTGSYTGGVTVTLSAVDDGSGVELTEYSLDAGGTWQRYFAPFTITAAGATAIDYRSVDRAGNVEPFGVAAFTIDNSQATDDEDDGGEKGKKGKKHNHGQVNNKDKDKHADCKTGDPRRR